MLSICKSNVENVRWSAANMRIKPIRARNIILVASLNIYQLKCGTKKNALFVTIITPTCLVFKFLKDKTELTSIFIFVYQSTELCD